MAVQSEFDDAHISEEMLDSLLGSVPAIKTQDDLFGKGGLLKNLTKRLMERLLEAEMTNHLGYMRHSIEGNNTGNSRNGKTAKTVKTGNGDVQISVPRDRTSEFAPVLIEKRQSHLKGLDDNILSLYAKGMTVRDIQAHLGELYGTEISRELISTITDAVLEDVKAWRNRPLDELYPIVFIDGFVAKCRLDGRVENRTVYVIYGINVEGQKDVLGLYLVPEKKPPIFLKNFLRILILRVYNFQFSKTKFFSYSKNQKNSIFSKFQASKNFDC